MRRIIRWSVMTISLGIAYWYASARMRANATGRRWGDVMAMDFRTFVTHRFDPTVMRLGLVGGRVSPWALLEHEGRVTGAIHRSPVMPRLADGSMFIPLPYGTDVQWLKNVLAAGRCRVQLHEEIFELDEPTVVMAADNPTLQPLAHQALDETPAHYLRLHVADRAPGTFAEPPHEFTVHPAPGALPTLEMAHPEPAPAEKPAVATA